MTRPEGELCSSKSALTWPPSSRDGPTDKQDTKLRPLVPSFSTLAPPPGPLLLRRQPSPTLVTPAFQTHRIRGGGGRRRTEKNRLRGEVGEDEWRAEPHPQLTGVEDRLVGRGHSRRNQGDDE